LDSDDWLAPGTLDKQFELAEQEKADVVVSGYKIYEQDKYIRTIDWTICDDFIAQNLGECDSSHYSAFLFRKEFIEDIPHRTSFASAKFASRDDRCFMLELALKEPKVAIFNEATLCHLHHEKGRLQFQQTLASGCTNFQHLLIYKNILRQLDETGRLTPRRIKASINVLWPLCKWIAKNDIREATGLLAWIKQLDPEFKIPEKGLMGFMYKKIGVNSTNKIFRFRRFFIS
jgi:hypothetical protein